MENASKALIMAGGVLVALLVIGLLLLMFNNVGEYQRSQNANKQSSQIAKFNMDFERYNDSKGISGADIVSLINKVNDYNRRTNYEENSKESSQATNYVDYSIKMTMRIKGFDSFNNLYGYQGLSPSDKIFSASRIDINYGTKPKNDLYSMIQKFIELEKNFNRPEDLKKLSGIYNRRLSDDENVTNMLNELAHLNIKNMDKSFIQGNLNSIKLYRQYSEFKLSTFRAYENEDPDERAKYAENGQIQSLYFKFIR